MGQFGLVFVVAVAAAAPQQIFDSQPQFVDSFGPEVRIISQKYEQDQVGNYEYSYDLSDGQRVQESGRFQPGSEPETGRLEQQGGYEYIGDDGNTYRVDYVANEGGYQARGAHLPQAPAQIPEYDQLRREHPELFWAENGGAGIVVDDQQFIQPQQFVVQDQFVQPDQFDQQQFSSQSQQFDGQQQLVLPLQQLVQI